MTKETLTIKDTLIARLIATKLAAIKAADGDVDSRRVCRCATPFSPQILTANEE